MRIFHHTDNDGKCAASIVLLAYPSVSIQLTPVDYKDPFPFDDIKPNEEVWIVDFHLAVKEDWERLLAITPNVKWFDHHVTAVEKFQEYKDRIPGTRAVGKAGCLLVWEYLFPSTPVPLALQMVNAFDLWKFQYGDVVHIFQCGLNSYDTSPDQPLWTTLLLPKGMKTSRDRLRMTQDMLTQNIQTRGKAALDYQEQASANLMRGLSFRTELDGLACIACNSAYTGSFAFRSVRDDATPLMAAFCFDGKRWMMTVYSETVDVSTIAAKRGGGGHKNAAGWVCDTLPQEFQTKPAIGTGAREALANYAHEAWTGWMKHLFAKSTKQVDDALLIPPDVVDRAQRQMATMFIDLPEEEKASDLEQADAILRVLGNQ